MKKYLYIALAAAALTSCSSDETLDVVQDEAIQFGNAFVENATRATDPTYGTVSLEKFNVYGTVTGTAGTVNIFNGDDVTGTVGDNVWNCDKKQYWIAGANYSFAAVVDGKESPNSTAVDANGMPTSITYATSSQKDLLYATATATGLATGNGKVNFTFNHLLAKAMFTVKSNTQDGYKYNVTNIKVNNFETGTYTVAGEGSWAGSTATDIEFGKIEGVTAADANGKTCETQKLLIPTTSDFTVSFTVDLYLNDTKLGTQNYTKTVTQDLVKGNSYNFNLDLKVGELIEFTVTDNPTWANDTDVTIGL